MSIAAPRTIAKGLAFARSETHLKAAEKLLGLSPLFTLQVRGGPLKVFVDNDPVSAIKELGRAHRGQGVEIEAPVQLWAQSEVHGRQIRERASRSLEADGKRCGTWSSRSWLFDVSSHRLEAELREAARALDFTLLSAEERLSVLQAFEVPGGLWWPAVNAWAARGKRGGGSKLDGQQPILLIAMATRSGAPPALRIAESREQLGEKILAVIQANHAATGGGDCVTVELMVWVRSLAAAKLLLDAIQHTADLNTRLTGGFDWSGASLGEVVRVVAEQHGIPLLSGCHWLPHMKAGAAREARLGRMALR